MEHMKEKLGSWQIGNDSEKGKVEFRLFFPSESTEPKHNIKTIQVSGDFQKALGNPEEWDLATAPFLVQAPHSEGEIWSWTTPKELPEGFYQYKYYVTFNDPAIPPRWVSDPFARYSGEENMNAAVVVGGSRPEDNNIKPLAGGRQPLHHLR